jgi:hypothetical protein
MTTGAGSGRLPGRRFRLGLRVLLLIAAVAYLAFMAASHSQPFDPGLEAPLASGGGLLFAAQLIHAWWINRRHGGGKPALGMRATLREHPLLAVYVAILWILLGAAAAQAGNVSKDCGHTAQTCIGLDRWSEAGGVYLRQFPYNAQGNADPNAPWVPISRAEYVAEVGERLRPAALFGVFSIAMGSVVAVAAEGAAAALPVRRRNRGLGETAGLGVSDV